MEMRSLAFEFQALINRSHPGVKVATNSCDQADQVMTGPDNTHVDDRNEDVTQPVPLVNRRSIGRAGLEIFSIVLAVLLALAVSEWQGSRNNQERTEAALQNVRTELTNNLELLQIVHESNAELINQLTENPTADDQNSQFLPALQIADSAWKTLGTTGLSGFVDFDLMVDLSQTYSLVDVYRRSGYSLVDANLWVIATATAAKRSMKEIDDSNLFAMNFISQFQLIVDIESALIDAHRKALVELDFHQQD